MQQDPEFENQGVNEFRERLRHRRERLARSGLVTGLGLIALLVVLGTGWMAHVRGRFHKLTTTQETYETTVPTARPGGQDLIRLERVERVGVIGPEFTSAILVPGDGMLVLQALVNLPSRGEVPLLAGTQERSLAANLNALQGAAFTVKASAREGTRWSSPTELVAGRPSSQQSMDILPDGSRAIARFAGSPTGVDATVSSTITSRGLDLSISAKNTSDTPQGLTLAWEPRFLAPSAGLQALALVLPLQENSLRSSNGQEGPLGMRDLDRVYTGLEHSYLNAGPELRLRNQIEGYTLHLTALTASIRSLHVQAKKGGDSVLVAFSTSNGDSDNESRTIVAPGETLQWRVRVEATANATYIPPSP